VEDLSVAIRRELTPLERNALVLCTRFGDSAAGLEQIARDLSLPPDSYRGRPARRLTVEDVLAARDSAKFAGERQRPPEPEPPSPEPKPRIARPQPTVGPNGELLCAECGVREVEPRPPGTPGRPRSKCNVCGAKHRRRRRG
jgi:hypothetical protein